MNQVAEKADTTKTGNRSIVLTDFEEFKNLEIEYIDTIEYDNSERQSGRLYYDSVPFRFHVYSAMDLTEYHLGQLDTIAVKTYPAAELYLLEVSFFEDDSITLRREIAFTDTLTFTGYPEVRSYHFWFSTDCPKDLPLAEVVKWKGVTSDLFIQLASKIELRSDKTMGGNAK